MLIQLGFNAAPGYRQVKSEIRFARITRWRPISATTPQIKLSSSMGEPCSRPTVGRGEVNSVFITVMLGVSWIWNFCCEDADHIIVTILLHPFTVPQMQIQKMHCYLCIFVYQ